MALMNVNAYMTKLQEQEDAKKSQQADLLNRIKDQQNVAGVMRPLASMYDYTASLNPYSPLNKTKFKMTDQFATPEQEQAVLSSLTKTMAPDNTDESNILRTLIAADASKQKAVKDPEDIANRIKFDTAYRTDPMTKALQEKFMAGSQLSVLTQPSLMDQSMAQEMTKRAMVIISGDKRPSDKDVAVFGNRPDLLNLAQALFDKRAKGSNFTSTDKEMLQKVVGGLKTGLKQQMDRHNAMWTRKAQITYGMHPTTAAAIIDSAAVSEPPAVEKDTLSGTGLPSVSDIDTELARRKK